MEQDTSKLFIEMLDNMNLFERSKLIMLSIGSIIVSFCRLVKYKIKEIFNHV